MVRSRGSRSDDTSGVSADATGSSRGGNTPVPADDAGSVGMALRLVRTSLTCCSANRTSSLACKAAVLSTLRRPRSWAHGCFVLHTRLKWKWLSSDPIYTRMKFTPMLIIVPVNSSKNTKSDNEQSERTCPRLMNPWRSARASAVALPFGTCTAQKSRYSCAAATVRVHTRRQLTTDTGPIRRSR